MRIANHQFPTIIGRALHEARKRKAPSEFSDWEECLNFLWEKRVEFSMDTDAGKALLGSPNGRGVGYLLAQHKSTFGAKGTVNKVTFFCSGGESEGGGFEEMHLLFHVVTDLAGDRNKRPSKEEHEKPPPPTEGVPKQDPPKQVEDVPKQDPPKQVEGVPKQDPPKQVEGPPKDD
jgi:hypothetical protein